MKLVSNFIENNLSKNDFSMNGYDLFFIKIQDGNFIKSLLAYNISYP